EWSILVRTDAALKIPEIDETNNVATAELAIGLQITPLPLGTPVVGTLAGSGGAMFYQIEAPGGTALRVALEHARDGDRTEVYVRRGALPTRAEYDYRYSAANSAEHSILVPYASQGSW